MANGQNYRLAVVVGYRGGRKVRSIGHYIVYVRAANRWLQYDDDTKKPISVIVEANEEVEVNLCIYVVT